MLRPTIELRHFALACTLLASGCASYTQAILPDEKPTGQEAYFYGRFSINTPKLRFALDGYQTMGHAYQCDNGQKYTLRFNLEQPLQVIKVSPANCTFVEVVFSNADGRLERTNPLPVADRRTLKIMPGKVYYLGDFEASASSQFNGGFIHTEWHTNSVRDNFDATTRDLKAAYPALESLQAEDNLPLIRGWRTDAGRR